MSKVYYEKSARGKQLIEMGSRCCGYTLEDCYNKPSYAKQKAFEYCYNKYLNTPNHEAFIICSYNTFGFTCSWLGLWGGQDALFFETKENSYVVLFDNVE